MLIYDIYTDNGFSHGVLFVVLSTCISTSGGGDLNDGRSCIYVTLGAEPTVPLDGRVLQLT